MRQGNDAGSVAAGGRLTICFCYADVPKAASKRGIFIALQQKTGGLGSRKTGVQLRENRFVVTNL
jgi:hypothetical protein